MSKAPGIISLVSLCILFGGALSLKAHGAAGLVAAYGFEEGQGTQVADSSDQGNNGTIDGATWTNGRFGKALLFNGTDALVRINNSASLSLTTGMTLEAWVYPTAAAESWGDAVYKADDSYYLEGSSPSGPAAMGGTFTSGPLYGSLLPVRAWSHLAASYDGTTMRLYVNGIEVNNREESEQLQTSTHPVTIGGDDLYGQFFQGIIDEVRIYNRALTASEIRADMTTPIADLPPDGAPPQVSLRSPMDGAILSNNATLSAVATDDQEVAAVEFRLGGDVIAAAFTEPYTVHWNSTTIANGLYMLTAIAIDTSGNRGTSAPVQVTIQNPAFVNEVVVPGIVSATTIAFLPDGRMLVGELTETLWVVQPGANQADSTPVLQLDNNELFGEQGLMDIQVDPNFSQNHFIYIFYTHGSDVFGNHNRVSRFTLNGNIVVAGSEQVLWEDDVAAESEHHGGALAIGLDGKLYITLGDQFESNEAQDLGSYHGKLLRINLDGTIPTDNPFYDGNGPNHDEIWALGLRNPFRMSIDPVSGTMFIGDVGGNDNGNSMEEVNIGKRGANYGWPYCEGYCTSDDVGFEVTGPLYAYPHAGRDACVVGGFVYRGNQFPAEYYGSYFFGDYVQNWIKRIILGTNETVLDVLDFEPPDGTKDGPYGDPVKLVQGPDGSVYYVDIGFNDSHVPNPASIRRIRYAPGNRPPVAVVSADPISGPAPLEVTFSSAGSTDPEGTPLTYDWQFGDGNSSAAANPTHSYSTPGSYTARLRLSDGTNTTISSNLTITAGGPPVATILSPQDGRIFRAGDVIQFAGHGIDPEEGELPDSAFTWTFLFHHEGHIHPGGVITSISSGTFTIPVTGHDFQGATSYEFILSVTDSDGLKGSDSVTIFPEKVNVSFDTSPSGLPLDVAGIRRTTPFVIDALIGFQYQISAPPQSQYQFVSWSDSGAATHQIVVPDLDTTLLASYEAPFNLTIQNSSGGVQLHFTATPGRIYRIEASPDLKTWQTIGSATASPTGAVDFQDTDRSNAQRFYRCVIR